MEDKEPELLKYNTKSLTKKHIGFYTCGALLVINMLGGSHYIKSNDLNLTFWIWASISTILTAATIGFAFWIKKECNIIYNENIRRIRAYSEIKRAAIKKQFDDEQDEYQNKQIARIQELFKPRKNIPKS